MYREDVDEGREGGWVRSPRFAFWVDRGGTFTDCILWDRETGRVRVGKFLSDDTAPVTGLRSLLGIDRDNSDLPSCEVRLGTTLGTNALLERGGPRTALVTSRGFTDLLRVRDQTRPDLFSLRGERVEPLAQRVEGLRHRGGFDGSTVDESSPDEVSACLRSLLDDGYESLAVAFVYGHRAQRLESGVAEAARRAGFASVVASHEVSSENGLLARAETTVVDAYLTPILTAYFDALRAGFGESSRLWIMQSGGGLAEPARFRGKDSVLSGPAGGAVACAHLATRLSLGPVVGLDMGGTSTDVSRFDGGFERRHETTVGGVVVRAPMVAVSTVAAGGGSVCRFDGDRLVVGPESAGASPGPLCYGDPAANRLTLTDVNLALGRLATDRFPVQLDDAPVHEELGRIAGLVEPGRDPLDIADGFFEIATEAMAAAIRQVSVAKGYDIREHTLVVFGGASGQHACALARRLGVRRVLMHPLAGVMSAWGIGLSPLSWHGEASISGDASSEVTKAAVQTAFDRLAAQGRGHLKQDGVATATVEGAVGLRYAGVETTLDVPLFPLADLVSRFEREHAREFGYRRPGHPVEATVVRVRAYGGGHEGPTELESTHDLPKVRAPRRLRWGGEWLDVPVVDREHLEVNHRVHGPLLVLDATGTLVVEPGFTAEKDEEGILTVCAESMEPAVVHRTVDGGSARAVDQVRLEVMSRALSSVAEQMGSTLQRSAMSTNIRDRLDFSCAVFDATGELVANAPHIPIHLGAMGESVRAVSRSHPDMNAGDVFVTNDPSQGGSHLPDITVVAPGFDQSGQRRFFVACRGHHADVGGVTPGSMAARSRSLREEGVVFRGERIVCADRFDEVLVRDILSAGPHPARRPDENLGDLQAQLASVRAGVRVMHELFERFGQDTVSESMQDVLAHGEACVRRAIGRLRDGCYRFEDVFDDGIQLQLKATVSGESMELDFSGTASEQTRSNLNAPRAVTIACVLYFLRTLVGETIPLNDGCLRPVSLIIPDRTLLSPGPDRAVAGGNVETSQRLVDVLCGAFGLCAASQGTMNNLTFGDDSFGYYETIGGGAGAGPHFAGASGVHVHMTNSRITDPEVLESRLPLRVEEFGLRRGSGGAGQHVGGDGLVREIRALAPLQVSVLSERRSTSPFGLDGGGAGATGRNLHLQLDGSVRSLASKATLRIEAGERIRIETPGGGGYGVPPAS